MSIQEDKYRIRQFKNGDREAFSQIFEQYSKKVYYFALGYLKTKSEAQDTVQEVFIRLWEKRVLLDEEKSISGFIFTLTYRHIIDLFRKKQATQTLFDQILQDTQKESSNTEEEVLFNELNSMYQQAIEQLPPKRKEVYLLSRHEGLTYQEIAYRLNISIKTVEHQISDALQFLRNYLQHPK
jgi:RNA polymerase sigma-70 factor, ECF subfamily